MKVKELVEQLLTFDQELEVFVNASDGDDLDYVEACSCADLAIWIDEEYCCPIYLVGKHELEMHGDKDRVILLH